MKITAFMKSLLPVMEKDKLVEDIRFTKTELSEYTIPSYKLSLDLYANWKFKNKEMQALIAVYYRTVDTNNKRFIESIYQLLEATSKNLDVVSELVDRGFGEEIIAAGLTYRKATLIQFAEFTTFVSKYSRSFLRYVYALEASEFDESSVTIPDVFTKAEMTWLKENFLNFCHALNATGNKDISKGGDFLKDVPDIVITDDNEDVLIRTLGDRKLDPLKTRFIPIALNPFYHIGLFVAEFQVKRHNLAKEELRSLQMKRLHLERLSKGENDAQLQQEIEYIDGRIQKLNFDIAKLESKKH